MTIKLEEWVPSPPARPGKYVLRMTKGDRFEIHIFLAAFAAKKFLELCMVKGEGWEVSPSGRLMRCEHGMRVRCHEGLLNEIMQHEYTRREDLWDLPLPDSRYAERFRLGVAPVEVVHDSGVARRQRRAAVRSMRQGMTTANDLAEEFECSPRDVRSVLRKAKVVKPVHGWAWTGDELEKIRELLKERL